MFANLRQALSRKASQCFVLPAADFVFEQLQCSLMILQLCLRIGDIEGSSAHLFKVLAQRTMLIIESARQLKTVGVRQIGQAPTGFLMVVNIIWAKFLISSPEAFCCASLQSSI